MDLKRGPYWCLQGGVGRPYLNNLQSMFLERGNRGFSSTAVLTSRQYKWVLSIVRRYEAGVLPYSLHQGGLFLLIVCWFHGWCLVDLFASNSSRAFDICTDKPERMRVIHTGVSMVNVMARRKRELVWLSTIDIKPKRHCGLSNGCVNEQRRCTISGFVWKKPCRPERRSVKNRVN